MRRLVHGLLRGLPFIAVAASLLALTPGTRAQAPSSMGAATEHPLATRAALDVLAKGGNAVDAIIAAVLVAGVVNPTSSGIGGGGFALVHRPGDERPSVLDFRETAPRALDPAAFAKAEGPNTRGQLVGTPGEVAGLFELNRRFGTRPWAELVAPAERHARRGFPVGAHLARTLADSSREFPDVNLKALYFRGTRPLAAGQLVRNEKLADTLRRVAQEGPPAFYDGPIAAELAATAQSAGGALSAADLREYRVKERVALRAAWGDDVVFTMPPPSAGGLLLLQTLGTLQPKELARLGWNTSAYQHLVAESFRASIADRLRFAGDPDFLAMDVAKLLDPARLAERRRRLSLDRTHAVPLFVSREQGTHHLSVMDSSGMTVALTTTVNRTFGAKLVAPDSGVVLNDELADFTLPQDIAAFPIAFNPNAPRPLARPVSSMTPTIVLRGGKPVLAIGGSGGPTIPTNVTQLLLGRLAFNKTPDELVRTPRFYVFHRGPTMLLEAGYSPAHTADLEFRGERVGPMRWTGSAVQILARDGSTVHAAADPRKFGSAEAR